MRFRELAHLLSTARDAEVRLATFRTIAEGEPAGQRAALRQVDEHLAASANKGVPRSLSPRMLARARSAFGMGAFKVARIPAERARVEAPGEGSAGYVSLPRRDRRRAAATAASSSPAIRRCRSRRRRGAATSRSTPSRGIR